LKLKKKTAEILKHIEKDGCILSSEGTKLLEIKSQQVKYFENKKKYNGRFFIPDKFEKRENEIYWNLIEIERVKDPNIRYLI